MNTYRITSMESTLQTNGRSINSTANQHSRFRTYMVVDANEVPVYEAEPAPVDNARELAEARADCQDFIDSQK